MGVISGFRRLCHRPRSQRGQVLIVFAMIIVPVTLVLGVVAVDVSAWQSERRGAQKDADYSALAGAYELLSTIQDANVARAAAQDNADINDEEGNAGIIGNIEVDNSCWHTDVLDSVMVNVSHEGRLFFGDAFINVPDIGAHARACMGTPIEGKGIFPLGIQVRGYQSDCFQPDPNDPGGPEIPIFGQFCRLAFAGADLSSGEGGWLRLFDDGGNSCSANNTGGGNQLQGEIRNGGADTTCYVAPPGTTSADCYGSPPPDWVTPYVNYCVFPKTQTFNQPTQRAFTDLLSGEGECDAEYGNGDRRDDFLEVVEAINGDPNPPPGTTTFAKRDCKSPRLVQLVIVEQFDVSGNRAAPILAFAAFYIHGCHLDENGDDLVQQNELYRDCNIPNRTGQASLYGYFINILDIGTIGAPNEYGIRAIGLDE